MEVIFAPLQQLRQLSSKIGTYLYGPGRLSTILLPDTYLGTYLKENQDKLSADTENYFLIVSDALMHLTLKINP